MVPFRPLPCGSIIDSPLFAASEMSHPCIYGVYFAFPCVLLQYFIHHRVTSLPFYSCLAYNCTAPSLLVSGYQVNHPYYYALSRKVIHMPPIFFHSIIIPSVSPSITLLWSLMPLLRIPYFLNSGRPSSIDLNAFTPEEWSRGRCTLVPDSIFVLCLRSSKGTHYFLLTSVFLMCSTSAPYHTIDICTLDDSVIQKIVPVIHRCVWDVPELIRGLPLR